MAAYVGMGMEAGHLLAASMMSAPASLVVAKIMLPETETSPTKGIVKIDIPRQDANILDAACRGAADGLKLALNVAAMLIAFIALIALANWLLGSGHYWAVHLFAGHESAEALMVDSDLLTFEKILGWVLSPLAWLMGVAWQDAGAIGQLLGKKAIFNEFLAYLDLAQMKDTLSPRSFTVATYALCGFANFGSVAIMIGGLGALEPGRRRDLAQLGFRAMLGGLLAGFMTATIAGMLI